MKNLLDIPFKGERDYLQGADIYNSLMLLIEDEYGFGMVSHIDVSFHRLIRSQLEIGETKKKHEPAAVICSFKIGKDDHKIQLFETGLPVTGRRDFAEEKIVAAMEFDETTRSGVLSLGPQHTDIEVWVAMTKAVHLRTLSHLKGKWLFVRTRFPKYCRNTSGGCRKVEIKSLFQDQLTRSQLLLDGQTIGEIYFSLAEDLQT